MRIITFSAFDLLSMCLRKSFEIALVLVLMLFLTSCEKNDGIVPQCVDCSLDSLKIDTAVSQVYVLNEGNYGWNNGSISIYTPEDKIVQNGAFQTANGFTLGDVVQSMEIIENKGYIVVNNSNKIEVVDLSTFNVETTIAGFNSPRYIKQVADNKAYVTSLYGNVIYVVDLQNNSIIDEISFNGWTEKLVVYLEKAYVVSPDKNKLLIIDVVEDKIETELKTTVFPNSLALDKTKKIWVLCGGGYQEELAELFSFDPLLNEKSNSFRFTNIDDSPNNLSVDAYGQNLYYLNGSVFKFNIEQGVLESDANVSNDTKNFYGLGVAPNGDIYVTDALNYTQKGFVYRYNNQNLIDSFKVSIIPGSFCFN